jgi:hypothetical protein
MFLHSGKAVFAERSAGKKKSGKIGRFKVEV